MSEVARYFDKMAQKLMRLNVVRDESTGLWYTLCAITHEGINMTGGHYVDRDELIKDLKEKFKDFPLIWSE